MAAAHLFEAATFLRKANRLSEIQEFVGDLDEEAQDSYRALLEIGDGGSGRFYEQLKHARNKSFHYQQLLLGDGEEHERLKQAMADHAKDEREQDISRGEIRDIPPPLTGFRAVFADDIATEMMLDKDTEKEFPGFVGNVSEHIAKFTIFTKATLNAYTRTRPAETWDVEDVKNG